MSAQCAGSPGYVILMSMIGWHGQDSLALGVIFAATDSVAVLQVLRPDRAPLLYSLVFGEGVINDATAVALLRAVQVCPCLLNKDTELDSEPADDHHNEMMSLILSLPTIMLAISDNRGLCIS